MLTYIVRRVLYSIPVLVTTTFLVFTFVSISGDPLGRLRANTQITAEQLHAIISVHQRATFFACKQLACGRVSVSVEVRPNGVPVERRDPARDDMVVSTARAREARLYSGHHRAASRSRSARLRSTPQR